MDNVVIKEPAASPGRKKALAQQYFGAWNSGDTAGLCKLVSAEFVQHANPEIVGIPALTKAIRARHEQGPKFHIFMDAVLGEGSLITVVGRIQEKRLDGTKVRDAVWTLRIDGHIAEVWSYLDLQDAPA